MIPTSYLDAARGLILALTEDDEPGRPAPCLLLLGDSLEPQLMVDARPEYDRDGADHVSEMALAVAAMHPEFAMLCLPGVYRDLHADEVLSRNVTMTAAHRTGEGVEFAVVGCPYLPEEGERRLGPAVPLDVMLAPAASLLYDAMTVETSLDPHGVAATLRVWDHMIGVPRHLVEAPGNLDAPEGLAVPSAKQRYDAHRLAREFSQRHRPLAKLADGFSRPAVPTGMPSGFVPACPL